MPRLLQASWVQIGLIIALAMSFIVLILIEGLCDISRVSYPCLRQTTGYDSITSFTETAVLFGDNGPL
jgi:hypothetical protein